MLAFLIILFISPFILFFLLTFPQFIWSLFQKNNKININLVKQFEKRPECTYASPDEILIKNVKNDVFWENKKYKLSELESIDIFIDRFSFLQNHAVFIFNFSFKRKLCVFFEFQYNFSTNKTSETKNSNVYKTNFTKIECQQIFVSLLNDINLNTHNTKLYDIIYQSQLSELFKHLRITDRFKFSPLELFFPVKILKNYDII